MTVFKNELYRNHPHLCCYISCGCNRTPDCLDWGNNNLVCFATCNSVAICDPSEGAGKIIATLPGHGHRVNSVRWIRSDHDSSIHETELVSTSSDNTAIVWSLQGGEFIKSSHLKGHTLSVNYADGIYLDEGKHNCTIASASADCTVKLWKRDGSEDEFTLAETISLGRGICVSLRYTSFSGKPLLALALDDCNVHLYQGTQRVLSLIGHQDWVRALAFNHTENSGLWLATGGQDSMVRVWKLTHDDESGWNKSPETTIHGHEGWVYGLQWDKNSSVDRLVSCSLDRTIVIWEPVPDEPWREASIFGELGGNTLGFLAVAISPSSTQILAASFQGAIHSWRIDKKNEWSAVGYVGGHFDSVETVAWEALKGRYLLSGSLDQTTRLHAPVTATQDGRWYELNRPQVHGHSVWFLSTLPGHKFASAAEEKVIRIFSATSNSIKNLAALNNSFNEDEVSDTEAIGAAVPSLGLSNKAVTQSDLDAGATKDGPRHANEEYMDSYFVPVNLSDIPTEDTLQQNTLWAEIKKLYGHGYEVFTLASSHRGDILASACKAQTTEHAAIILWNTSTWEQIGKIVGHSLTVTRMAFSPDDSRLLSVSRDRHWILSAKQDDGTWAVIKKCGRESKAHSRIIWCCSWSPNGEKFATCSRNGRAALWTKDGLESGPWLDLKTTSINAIALAEGQRGDIVAVGTEPGDVLIYSFSNGSWKQLLIVPLHYKCSLCVKQLAFRPRQPESNSLELAIASQDCSVRILKFDVAYYEQSIA